VRKYTMEQVHDAEEKFEAAQDLAYHLASASDALSVLGDVAGISTARITEALESAQEYEKALSEILEEDMEINEANLLSDYYRSVI